MTTKPKAARGGIRIAQEMCKSCGYCLEHCPKRSIVLASVYNAKGYYPAEFQAGECTGCGICAIMCPEAIIEVWRE